MKPSKLGACNPVAVAVVTTACSTCRTSLLLHVWKQELRTEFSGSGNCKEGQGQRAHSNRCTCEKPPSFCHTHHYHHLVVLLPLLRTCYSHTSFHRWASAGAFYPFSRNHYTYYSRHHEYYRWPDVAESAKRAYGLRYRLLTYLYSSLYLAHKQGGPVAKPLLFVDPRDIKAR